LFRIRSKGKAVLDNVRFLSHESRGQKRSEERSEAITTLENEALKAQKHRSKPQRSTATRLALVDASLAV
jgi:hypothetical protein